ncbi:glycosyltransferase [Flavobacterium sp.]|uniref:glycosyltransferase n=1 Tax=Flavobacterium sp. TaxID=239 RepID=UPI00286E70D6|nr:glycosyltransferase [Flavobacterium sp.]
MKNRTDIIKNQEFSLNTNLKNRNYLNFNFKKRETILPEILFITSFPPRECGIATYSQDLIDALNTKFKKSFNIIVAALELGSDKHDYSGSVEYVLETDNQNSYLKLAEDINKNNAIELVVIEHEFGLFKTNESDFIEFLKSIKKPIVLGFHTVLPNPNLTLQKTVLEIDSCVDSFIVMTKSAAKLLVEDYKISIDKINIIPHGTHLVEHSNKDILKEKYNIAGRKIISTFGLLSSGKCIETSINALQTIVKEEPNVLFLVIGKTHPTVVKNEGEIYRESLQKTIADLHLDHNVKFINQYLPLNELLDYLQLTDIYLFTSKDRHQAVSGTFSYAISCGCPIISTPIPHAVEVLQNGTGIIIDFENPQQLAEQVIKLLNDKQLRKSISANGIHKLAPTAWENSAIAHAKLFKKQNDTIKLHYSLPEINLKHFKNLTTSFGMIQFSEINQPNLNSGYTLDDNARALVAICQHFELTKDASDIKYILLYYKFIKHCLQSEGYFLNYVDENRKFTKQNNENLADANGRAIWALGYLISISDLLPEDLILDAQLTIQKTFNYIDKIHSPRAMSFIIKGIYYSNKNTKKLVNTMFINHLANRLVQMFRHESKPNWEWYESYLTYGNSIIPEAMLCAYLQTGDEIYKDIAKTSFDFLLSKIFTENTIKVISNKGWMQSDLSKNNEKIGGEQPIDVAYTIIALSSFYEAFNDFTYLQKMELGFSWFLGNNHLEKIIYNPSTGGCYDGLEEDYINLNQGAESTVSYLMARLKMEKDFNLKNKKSSSEINFQKPIVQKSSISI